jgi:cytochrome c553
VVQRAAQSDLADKRGELSTMRRGRQKQIGFKWGAAETHEGWGTMVKSFASAILGVVVVSAIAAGPARAADDIESRVGICTACHGQNGQPATSATPVIWGQQANYLYKELHDYHSGDRASPIMSPIVKTFSLEDLRKVANYFAAKPWPAAQGGAAASPPEKITMCRACHGQNFEGGAPAPRLAGLSYEYLAAAMRGFADGTRTNNLDMPGFMRALTDRERDAMARYLAGL